MATAADGCWLRLPNSEGTPMPQNDMSLDREPRRAACSAPVSARTASAAMAANSDAALLSRISSAPMAPVLSTLTWTAQRRSSSSQCMSAYQLEPE